MYAVIFLSVRWVDSVVCPLRSLLALMLYEFMSLPEGPWFQGFNESGTVVGLPDSADGVPWTQGREQRLRCTLPDGHVALPLDRGTLVQSPLPARCLLLLQLQMTRAHTSRSFFLLAGSSQGLPSDRALLDVSNHTRIPSVPFFTFFACYVVLTLTQSRTHNKYSFWPLSNKEWFISIW